MGIPVLLLREPGGTVIGEKIRSILLDRDHGEMAPATELFLYLAARAQITAERIVPALKSGTTVILDRFFDSTAAYQGYARGLGLDTVLEMNIVATGGVIPDQTFLFDCEVPLARSRLSSVTDRLESESDEFFERVREGFLRVSRQYPSRFFVLDASLSPEVLSDRVYSAVVSRLFS